MKPGFLSLPPEERETYFEQAAAERDVLTEILEKDFWVCWVLGVLFESEFAGNLVFKGGTSLSKVFHAINRFSEDIDLSLSPEFLGLPEAGGSRNQADKWMKNAEAECGSAVRDRIRPALENASAKVLGPKDSGWFEFLTDENSQSPLLLFHYPSQRPDDLGYIKRTVKLEFGSLTDQQPTDRHNVKPWIADTYPSQFQDWKCQVVALEAERTFWEKATILHAEHHRPAGKPTPDRISRHYADVAALADHQAAVKALSQDGLRKRVVEWKSRFFAKKQAKYEEAVPGTFRLLPHGSRINDLRKDYKSMRVMYLSEPPRFEEILDTLRELEERINQTGEE